MTIISAPADKTSRPVADTTEMAHAYERHRGEILRYLRRRAGPQAAEDLAAETWARAARYWGQWADDVRGRGPWLMTIARNLLATHWRLASRAPLLSLNPDVHDRVDPDPRVDPQWVAIRQDECRQAMAALTGLPERQELILRLRYLEDLSLAETATALDATPGAIAVATHRAVTTVRKHMQPAQPRPTGIGEAA